MSDDAPSPLSVHLRAARIPGILSFAEHYWLEVRDGTRAERWEVWQHADAGGVSWGHLHRDLLPLESGVGNGPGRLVAQWDGEQAGRLRAVIAASPTTYPWADRYRLWPGPNSNTYVQWVLGRGHVLGWRGFGKRFASRNPRRDRSWSGLEDIACLTTTEHRPDPAENDRLGYRPIETLFACGLAMQLPCIFVWASIFIDRFTHARSPEPGSYALGLLSFSLSCAGFAFTTVGFFMSIFASQCARRGIVWIAWVYPLGIIVWVAILALNIATRPQP